MLEDIPRVTRNTSADEMLEIYDFINERYDELYAEGYRVKNPSDDKCVIRDGDREMRCLYQRRLRLFKRRSEDEWEKLRESLNRAENDEPPSWMLEPRSEEGWNEIRELVRIKNERMKNKQTSDDGGGEIDGGGGVSEDSEESEELTYYVAKVYSDGTIEPI
jgi:hypothetical protein